MKQDKTNEITAWLRRVPAVSPPAGLFELYRLSKHKNRDKMLAMVHDGRHRSNNLQCAQYCGDAG